MQVTRLMQAEVITVLADESLSTAVRLMWDRDLGALPVVEGTA